MISGCAHGKLHRLCTGSPQLAADDNLTALGAALHDEPEHTVACPPDGQTVEQLVPEGFALGHGRETAVLDLGGVEGDGVFGKLEALLNERRELPDAAALLAQDLLCVRGADDNVGHGGCYADFDTRVSLLGQLALEEFVEFGVKDTICATRYSLLLLCFNRPRLGTCIQHTSDKLSALGAIAIVSGL